jgi:hypothetical protein
MMSETKTLLRKGWIYLTWLNIQLINILCIAMAKKVLELNWIDISVMIVMFIISEFAMANLLFNSNYIRLRRETNLEKLSRIRNEE